MKRLFLVFFFVAISIITFATHQYFRAGVTNWNDNASWSLTDGGGATGTIPVNTDSVYFTVNSANCTVNAAGVAKVLDFTGYTGTITMTNNIIVSGSVTLVVAMGIAGTSGLTVNATGTLTSNTKTWPNAFTFAGTSQTYTLADNWDIDGTLTFSGVTAQTINGFTIYAGGSLTATTPIITSGTTVLTMNGTGTWSNSSIGRLANNLEFNTADTITISGTVRGTNITYTSGTIVTTSSLLYCQASAILNTNGIIWNDVTFAGTSQTYTLSSDMDVDGTLYNNSMTLLTLNGNTIYAGGSFTIGYGTSLGTTNIILNGTGTWSCLSNFQTRNNVTINTAGTITLGANVYFGNTAGNTLTYTAGTLVTTGSTLYLGTCTLNLNNLTLNNLNIWLASKVITLSSGLKIAGQLSAPVTGSSIVSNSAGTQRKLTMLATSTQSISATNNIDATDIDSGDGLPIVSEGAILSNTNNWYSNAGTLTNFFIAW